MVISAGQLLSLNKLICTSCPINICWTKSSFIMVKFIVGYEPKFSNRIARKRETVLSVSIQ